MEIRLSENVANATVNRELAALKRMFSLAIITGKIDRLGKFAEVYRNLRKYGKVGALVCALDFKRVN